MMGHSSHDDKFDVDLTKVLPGMYMRKIMKPEKQVSMQELGWA
jgi:hypothetical protein